MTGKKLEAQLVDFYFSLDDAIATLIASGALDSEEWVLLRNKQIELDRILVNCSKEWSKKKKLSRKDKRKWAKQ